MLCSCQGALRRIRRLNRRDSPLGRSLVSTDLTSDGISATGCPQRFAPEDDTEFSALKEISDNSFRTFVDVPFCFFEALIFTNLFVPFAIAVSHSPFAFRLRTMDGCSMGLVTQIIDLDKSATDLGLSSGVSTFAYSLERR